MKLFCAMLATVVAILTAVPTAQANGRPDSLVWSASCPVDVIFTIPVDADRARAFVPDHYSFLGADATGKAWMIVSLLTCQDTVVGGVPRGTVHYSDLLFFIDTPPGGGTPVYFPNGYWSWFISDDPKLHADLSALGMFQGLDPHLSLTTTPTGSGFTLDGSVSWPYSPFRIHGTVVGQSSPGIAYTPHFYQDVHGGVLEAQLQKTDERWRDASFTLTTPVGSRLAWVLGGQCRPDPGDETCSFSGPGFATYLTHFDYDITVDRRNVPHRGPARPPRLRLRLQYRSARLRHSGRRCALGPIRATVAGADRAKALSASFYRRRRRVAYDRRQPLSRVVDRGRHRGRSHRHRLRVRVRMSDGRRIRLLRRYRVCADSGVAAHRNSWQGR